MSYIDLHSVLRDWPYEPDKISVRKILGADGNVRIQMRVELGVLQMDAEGRPDGYRPHGHKTLLHYHRSRVARYEQKNGTALGFTLAREDCQELRVEASLFYRRYVALFVLEEYPGVIADTTHSLGIFDLCRDYAADSDDRVWLEEFRAYVLMMQARARAYQAIEENEPTSALAHVNRGIIDIRAHYDRYRKTEAEENSEELKVLRGMARELGEKVPKDSLIVTRRALRDAIEQERFEDAARLRDTLKNLYNHEA
jgi:hypothetical protein